MLRFLVRVSAFCVVLLAALELVFRFVVPAAEMPAGRQDPRWMIMNFDPTGDVRGVHSMGRYGRPAFHWSINRTGYNSAYEYLAPQDRDEPCAVVIGNSYLEGLYSDVDRHLAARLHERFAGGMDFYNLGSSGMPLSQVPRVVAFAQAEFAPEVIVIGTGASSVPRSLVNNGKAANCQQYRWADGALDVVPPSRFRADPVNRLLRRSALVRYLFYNAKVNLGGKGEVVKARADRDEDAPGSFGGLPRSVYEELLDRIFTEIRTLSDARVLVVHDGDRQAVYDGAAMPPRLPGSDLLEEACRRHGFLFLDLTETFWRDYARNGRPFNFDIDYHWDPYGVQVVADAVARQLEAAGVVAPGSYAAAAAGTD